MAPTPPKLGWLLKQNKRYAPLLDTGLKLGPIPLATGALLALPMLFLFNAYLGQLNQPAIPVSQAGDWVFLLLFSILVSLLFALIVLIPAAWTGLVRWNAPALPERKVRAACGVTALVTVCVVGATVWMGEGWTLPGLALATVAGGVAGALVTTEVQPPYARAATAWTGFAASAFLIVTWLATLWSLLSLTVDAPMLDHPAMVASGLLLLLLVMLGVSIVKPPVGILAGILLTVYWVTEQASPDGGTMIASALYTANLGGGRPAQTAQPKGSGEICNLGVADRPVVYFEAKGCSRAAAFRRLRELEGKDSLGRRRQMQLWTAVVERHRGTATPLARP